MLKTLWLPGWNNPPLGFMAVHLLPRPRVQLFAPVEHLIV